MTGAATATARANIAFVKYWGKRPGDGNYPAVPSLSVTLAGLETTTCVTFREDLPSDRLALDGEPVEGRPLERVRLLLDRVRQAGDPSRRLLYATVVTQNDFPTASGLASSASGFAALALAAVHASGLSWELARVADLARRSSASAARSLYGGWVELLAGPDRPKGDELLTARQVAPCGHVDWRVLVAIAGEAKKVVGSTEGMRTTMLESPYYDAWLALGPRIFVDARGALLARDFEKFGALSEKSALAMHASAVAAGVVYWSGVTLDALAAVRDLRRRGTPAYATMDAGPHVKVLVRGQDAALAGTWLRAVPGVTRVLEATAGEGARIVPLVPSKEGS